MPAFKELAKKFRKTVEVAGQKMSVRGLNGDELAGLVVEFPEFEKMFSSGFGSIDTKAMIDQAPAGMAKIVALGLSENGELPSAEDIAVVRSGFPAAVQLELLAPIAELSLPRVIAAPFVALIRGDDGAGTTGKDPDTKSPSLP